MTTFTTSSNHEFQRGDVVIVKALDRNKWRRFWHWITFRSPPMVETKYTVTDVGSYTQFNGLPLHD